MVSSIYVLIVTLLIFIFSFLTSKWSQLQMDIFTGAVGLLVTITATMEIILGTPGSNTLTEGSIRIGDYILLLVIIHITFGIFIISIFKAYQKNYIDINAVIKERHVADRMFKIVWFPFVICVFGYSISLLASATIYAANISILNNYGPLLQILKDPNARGGEVGLILKTIFLPDYIPVYYYPVFLLLAVFIFSLVLAGHLVLIWRHSRTPAEPEPKGFAPHTELKDKE